MTSRLRGWWRRVSVSPALIAFTRRRIELQWRLRGSPVRAELAALLRHPTRGHLVLVDDARLFPGASGYPTIDELRAWVERERPGSRLEVAADIIRCALDAEDAVF